MESGLSINKHLYSLLSGDAELEGMVGNNIYPLIAEEDVKFPFIIFSKTSLTPEYNKCGVTGDVISFSVAIAAQNYFQTVDIAEKVRGILELHRDSYFTRVEFSGVTEEYMEDSYIQTLNFTARINF